MVFKSKSKEKEPKKLSVYWIGFVFRGGWYYRVEYLNKTARDELINRLKECMRLNQPLTFKDRYDCEYEIMQPREIISWEKGEMKDFEDFEGFE